MTSFNYELKIPKDRVAVVIGKDGSVKKQIEEETHTSVKIDSKEGEITVSGEDGLGIYTARSIILAIGRGFNPEVAMLMLKTDYLFEIINMNDYGRNKNDVIRLKGRVIGAEGKTRRLIEEMTDCSISVYGKTIGMIGETENLAIARKAIESLLQGSPHSSVYKFLEKQRKVMKMRAFGIKDDMN